MMYLAIDYGRKRIGLAVGQVLPRGAGIIDAELPKEKVLEKIKQICRENEVQKIVIGLPIRSQGERGTLADEIELFGQSVSKETGLPVVYEPEQFTSAEAEEMLRDKNYPRSSGKVDELAAILILEQYLHGRET